jgi:hypothetical protein
LTQYERSTPEVKTRFSQGPPGYADLPAALATSKKKFGGYRGVPPTAKTRAAAYEAHRAKTAARAALLKPEIERARRAGATTWRAVAAELNARNIPTATGVGSWSGVQVGRVLAALGD